MKEKQAAADSTAHNGRLVHNKKANNAGNKDQRWETVLEVH